MWPYLGTHICMHYDDRMTLVRYIIFSLTLIKYRSVGMQMMYLSCFNIIYMWANKAGVAISGSVAVSG